MLVNVKTKLYEQVRKVVEKNPVEFATIQQFVNLAVKEKLEEVQSKK